MLVSTLDSVYQFTQEEKGGFCSRTWMFMCFQTKRSDGRCSDMFTQTFPAAAAANGGRLSAIIDAGCS